MRLFAGTADDRLLSSPLLDRAELVALIRLGEHLARSTPARRSDSGRHGGEAARRLGEGMDFAEHRRYQPGDDPRRINWRLTARHGEPHVRRYHEDVTAPCVILLDRRAAMRFGTRRRLKLTQAIRLAMVLAAYHAARQASIRVLEIDSREHFLPATDNRGLLPLGLHLAEPCPPARAGEPALDQALVDMDRHLPAGARLILLSDFADADSVSTEHWHRLARRHPIDAICIEDPAEIELPAGPAILSWDARETPLDGQLQARLAAEHGERLSLLAQTLAGCGITLQRLSTAEDALLPCLQALQR